MAIPGYQILRKVGEGGMSSVYLAIQLSVGREVALKILAPELRRDPDFGDRFFKEANIVGTLSHPNIISIYDVGSHDGHYYMAMDYLPGDSCRDKIKAGNLSLNQAVKIVRELSSALDYIHEKGFVHCDIKSDNILFNTTGMAVLTDFGIASRIQHQQQDSVAGTPNYMSPEQSQGAAIDGRSDIYSLGILFYEMLTGNVPFQAKDAASVAIKHLSARIPALPEQYQHLQPVINKMLAKKPSARYQRGKEVIQALAAVESNVASLAEHTQRTEATALQAYSLFGALMSTLGRLLLATLKTDLTAKHSSASSGPNDAELTRTDMPAIKRVAFRYPLIGLAATALIALAMMYLPFTGPSESAQLTRSVQAGSGAIDSDNTEASGRLANATGPARAEAPASGTDSQQHAPQKAKLFALEITASPADARIRILNIAPRYEFGMLLAPGPYHVDVSRPGYRSHREWLNLKDSSLSRHISLAKAWQAGDTLAVPIKSGGHAPKVVVIPAGQMQLQSADSDESERRHKTITFTSPFAIGMYEVTYAEYDRFATATGRELPEDYGMDRSKHPVSDISYSDAQAYAAWLSAESGKVFRLPSESEWEYAARAGSRGDYWWGEENPSHKANCRRDCDSEWVKFLSASSAPVGSFAANPFNLYDTSGNIAEWVADCYLDQRQDAPANGSRVWRENCDAFVVRGGSFKSRVEEISNTSRDSMRGDKRSRSIGVRLVMEL